MGCGSSTPVSPTIDDSPATAQPNANIKTRNLSTTEMKMEARSKIHRKKNVRVRVDDGVVDFAAIPDVPKSDEDRKFLSEALNHQWLFQSMDTEALGMVISKMTKRDYEQGDNIVTQVSEHADLFISQKQIEPVLLLFLLRFF
jgi:hypothetical protein|tara:strand:+ start:187 stop:615 length:429 start_codon:yes stop_codon:yes gene_type:complete